ncbi:hypothetical protein COU60_04960 [Candidatus Pacearchaeota archaeon CG10_big_fil_rev_8_21_14_0_10_34_76]|nr:MAG: hypothetical protein COU60_04960 [Candidatus Pacearchaeota archaeon CG10_big_fil_rev_8_21_14_0_10_34_76]
MAERKLNLDIPKAIVEFESVLKQFQLREKIYKIVFRGRGLEFDGYRDYSSDEDASGIDWKASVRSNRLLVKKYIEERDLKIIFAIDVSENMVFGSTEKVKCEFAAEVCAALSHLIMTSNDKIGFIFFNNEVLEFVPPKSGLNQFSLFTNSLSSPFMYGGASNIKNVLDFILESMDQSISAVIMVSDFSHFNDSMLKSLTLLGNRTEVISLVIKDPLDKTLPLINKEFVLEDPFTSHQVLINPSIAKNAYEKNALKKEKEMGEIFRKSNIDFLELNTDKPFNIILAEFLIERIKRGRFII